MIANLYLDFQTLACLTWAGGKDRLKEKRRHLITIRIPDEGSILRAHGVDLRILADSETTPEHQECQSAPRPRQT